MAVSKKIPPTKSVAKQTAKRSAAKAKAVVPKAKKAKAAPVKKAAAKKVTPKKAVPKKVVKKVVAKKAVKSGAKKAVVKKTVPKKVVAKKSVLQKKAVVKKVAPSKPVVVKKSGRPVAKKKAMPRGKGVKVDNKDAILNYGQPVAKDLQLTPWLKKQYARLLALKDTLLDSMTGTTRENLRNAGDSDKASAHGMHQADAGSDAYDRDFALSQLSQEQNALVEIEDALKRIENGTYGVCEMSNKPIPKVRLEARPFARYTVECQSEIERKNRHSRYRQPMARLFDNLDDESGDEGDDDAASDSKE